MRKVLIFFFPFLFLASLSKFYYKKINLNLFEKEIIEIKILNLKNLSEKYIFDSIEVRENQNFWKFNPKELKKNLSEIKEIDSFQFNMEPSGILKIIVNEKIPSIKWVDKNKIIDYNGNYLNLNVPGDAKVINLFGKDANKEIGSFNKIVDRYPFFKSTINSIYFNKNIGWKVKFFDNRCLYLPDKEFGKVIEIFEKIKKLRIYKKYQFYDMRILGRIYLNNKECSI